MELVGGSLDDHLVKRQDCALGKNLHQTTAPFFAYFRNVRVVFVVQQGHLVVEHLETKAPKTMVPFPSTHPSLRLSFLS